MRQYESYQRSNRAERLKNAAKVAGAVVSTIVVAGGGIVLAKESLKGSPDQARLNSGNNPAQTALEKYPGVSDKSGAATAGEISLAGKWLEQHPGAKKVIFNNFEATAHDNLTNGLGGHLSRIDASANIDILMKDGKDIVTVGFGEQGSSHLPNNEPVSGTTAEQAETVAINDALSNVGA